jgi:phosphatidate cytidylyltransferase
MHLKRWLTSIIALPLLAALILMGGEVLFSFFISAITLLTIWEYSRMVMEPASPKKIISITYFGLLTSVVIIWAAHAGLLAIIPLIFSFNLIIIGFLSFRLYPNDPDISRKIAFQCLGVIYISLSISYLVLIRQEPFGDFWVLFIIAVVFAGDTAAYYAGTYWGKHKLCPAVSPGKTVEGAVGGVVANLIIGLIANYYKPSLFPLSEILLFSLIIGMVGQVGDLFESVLKRSAGVKDSGELLPGHGGMLDRIDAMLFALPVAYFMKVAFFTI